MYPPLTQFETQVLRQLDAERRTHVAPRAMPAHKRSSRGWLGGLLHPARRNAKIELIKRVLLFSHCTRKELGALAATADEVTLPAGKALTRQGEPGREFVIIVEGAADVTKNGRRINRLGAGDFLGEIALISGHLRTATVTTTCEVRILVLTEQAFKRITDAMPSVRRSVLSALAERLQADLSEHRLRPLHAASKGAA